MFEPERKQLEELRKFYETEYNADLIPRLRRIREATGCSLTEAINRLHKATFDEPRR